MIFTDDSAYDIRYSEEADGEILTRWLKSPEVMQWMPQNQASEVELFARNWIGFSRYRASLTAVYNGKPVGIATLFLMPYIKVAHTANPYIVVDPKYQRRGVGFSLMKNLKHLAKHRFRLESLFIDLFEGSPAIGLMKKMNFETIAFQEDYFRSEGRSFGRYIMGINL